MRAQPTLTVCLIILLCSSVIAGNVTVDPSDPMQLVTACYTAGSRDTVFLLPGTHVVGGPIHLTHSSPSFVGVGGPDGVIMLGTGVEQAFFLDRFVWDAHIHIERITFRGLSEIIGRVSTIDGATGEIHFTDNIVEDCGTGPNYPPLRATGCWGIIARNIFRNNRGYAIVTYHTSAAIEDNEMYGSRGGIDDWCCTSPPTRRNHIHDNSSTAISTGYNEGGILEYNVIERNGGAGISMGHSGTIQHNVIRENAIGVVSSSWIGTGASIHYNDIYDNTQANLKATTENVLNWDCTMNWWGTTDPGSIPERIWDCHDDLEVGTCVVFEPFCLSPGCGPVAVEPLSWGAIKALYR